MDYAALKRINCKHEHFIVFGGNLVGQGTCLDCGQTFGLDILFNILHDKMQKKITEMEELIKEARGIS